jgi:nuclear pore complex protein Nup153
MAKDNDGGNDGNSNNNNLSSTPSTSSFKRARSKPYDANNSFVKKVATKVSDLIPQRSWIRNWFNSSQDEAEIQNTETDNSQYNTYEDKQSQPPPSKRPCIRMDVTYPPGTFTIKKRNSTNEEESSKEQFSNHNETTQDFLEPTATGSRLRFVASTPAYPMNTGKVADPRSSLNVIMSEQNNGATNGTDDNSESSESTSGCSSLIPQNNRQEAPTNTNYNSPFGNKRRFIDDKLSFTNHLQSPRSLFLDSTARETLSSRRPSFNPSVVNNSLERSASLSSPFYPGNTMFGGANAANLYNRGSSVLSDVSVSF